RLHRRARRARHRAGHGYLQPRDGTELRPEDRRRRAGRGAARPAGGRGLPRPGRLTVDLLEVQDVAVSYGKLRAVKGVSFTVRRGEVVALLGSNGSGKSTLLRTIAGVLAPTGGRIAFDGDDITGWTSHRVARRGLRLVPEGRGLMGQYAGGGDARDLDAALARFPVLGQRCQQIASTLSGGAQQMLAIARALVARPALLMLDEPSLGLAPRLIREVFQVVAELKREDR